MEILNPCKLPSVELKERLKLPDKPCVYFVLNESEVLYIGQSKNLRKRWSRHHLYSELKILQNVKIHYLSVFDTETLTNLERKYIGIFQPKLNLCGTLNFSGHPNSIANLKLGAVSRRSGKERYHYTVLPEHHAWLASGGNASIQLDEVIGKILAGELVGIQHVRKAEAEIERLKKLLAEKEKNT